MPGTASTVPPFIPGLLIVSLLIIISILIGWRNYARRGNPRLMPGMNDWAFWDVEPAAERGANRAEKPKMWEVGVGRGAESEKSGEDGDGWGGIMPLSAASVLPEPPPKGTSQPPEASRNSTTSPSRLSRLNFRSSSPTTSPPPSCAPPAADRLQVSVLISMPSPHIRTRNSVSSSCSAPDQPAPSIPQRASTSSSLMKEPIEADPQSEKEWPPEVAFGVAVLPWRRSEDVEPGDTNIAVT